MECGAIDEAAGVDTSTATAQSGDNKLSMKLQHPKLVNIIIISYKVFVCKVDVGGHILTNCRLQKPKKLFGGGCNSNNDRFQFFTAHF